MDQFDLEMNQIMNSSLFLQKSSSNDSLNFFNNDFFLEKDNQDENFTENFNKIFPQNLSNNNEDSFSLDSNNLNINNVENFIIYFQNKLSNYYFNKDFDAITAEIEKKFPFFFSEKNIDLIYMIEKLKFFKLLGEDKIEEAKKFYQEKLLILIKEIKKQNWEKKSKFFISLIKRPNLIGKPDDFLKKYYDQFVYELEKAIRTFLHEEKNDYNENENIKGCLFNSNNSINVFSSSSSEFHYISKVNDNVNYNKNKEYINEKEIRDGDNNIIIDDNNNENENNDLDLENCSTKEEFSDFEDVLQPKLCGQNEVEMKDNKNDENRINNTNEEENEFSIDTSSKKTHIYFQGKPNIDYNKKEIICNNKEAKKAKKKENEIIFNQLPFLKSFKPRYIKRETIDKKIIRNFKNYVVKEYKEKKLEINNVNMDVNFFINFINRNLLPPIDFYDGVTGEYIKFNSFNCNYLLWFFSKKGVKDIYMQFINEKGKEFINNISQHYGISPEEKNQLNNYILNFPFIFDITLVNNITQGATFSHIYRTIDKNKIKKNKRSKKENDIDLKRKKSDSINGGRERSRSKDLDDDY